MHDLTADIDVFSAWERFRQPLKAFVLSRVRDESLAHDLLHDVILKLYDYQQRGGRVANMRAFLYQTVRNRIADHFRAGSKQQTVEQGYQMLADDEGGDELHHAVATCLRATIERMAPAYREALTLTELEGWTQQQLAEHLNISLSGAKSRVQRGRRKLRALLEDCCRIEHDRYGTVIDMHPRSNCTATQYFC